MLFQKYEFDLELNAALGMEAASCAVLAQIERTARPAGERPSKISNVKFSFYVTKLLTKSFFSVNIFIHLFWNC